VLGYSYREITEMTGWTFTKVNRCSAEGRARLRELGLEIYKSH
jgi:DNA-directed RNA polymerase specialized sigma24 family protein